MKQASKVEKNKYKICSKGLVGMNPRKNKKVRRIKSRSKRIRNKTRKKVKLMTKTLRSPSGPLSYFYCSYFLTLPTIPSLLKKGAQCTCNHSLRR